MTPLLDVRGLRAGYEGIPVVFGLNLSVEVGEIVAILGPNGAGKTTSLRAISGVVPAMSGAVVFEGTTITNSAPERVARRGLVQVPEGRGLFPSLTVGETLRLAAAVAGVPRGGLAERLAFVHDIFPVLAGRAGQTVGTLSGGEQQMLALARGLVVRPKLLMVDEMSQGLAPSVVDGLFEIVGRFPEMGTSVLVVEQFVDRALAIASRAYVLEKGEVAYHGSAADLAADEKFVRGSYLGDLDDAASLGARAEDGHAQVLTEDVSMSLPPIMLRELQRRAEEEGLPLDELLRRMVEAADHAGAQVPGGPR